MKRDRVLIALGTSGLLIAVTLGALRYHSNRNLEVQSGVVQQTRITPLSEPTKPGERMGSIARASTSTPSEESRIESPAVVQSVDSLAKVASRTNTPTKKVKAKKVIQDPLARDALAMVGIDPEAETYWFGAIHNSSLGKSERQDLIDDLNEAGLPDPKHPTMDDLPLILSRLEILEDLVPSLTDEFDWKESYEDLLNLAAVAMGGGKPVR